MWEVIRSNEDFVKEGNSRKTGVNMRKHMVRFDNGHNFGVMNSFFRYLINFT